MATAIKHVTKPVDPPYTVALELSQEEAEYLKWLLGRVSADRSLKPAGEHSVFVALESAGVTSARGFDLRNAAFIRVVPRG